MEYESVMSGLMLHYPFLVDFDGSSVSTLREILYADSQMCNLRSGYAVVEASVVSTKFIDNLYIA